jgi:L-ascorbate metabolism protein UlaG (beta-lactamase superfamily)
MDITWLGQGGFLVEWPGARIAVDPYLSDSLAHKSGHSRLVAAPLTPRELAPTLVVCTHDHDDHFNPVTLAEVIAASPACVFAGPPAVARHAEAMGVPADRCRAMNAFDRLAHGPATLTATPARHGGDAMGLIVEHAGRRVYISGDSLYFPELAADVARTAGGPLDLVLICINGRAGNMTWQEALEVVKALRPRAAVPMHYGMFAANTADPVPFVSAVKSAGVGATTLEVGVRTGLDQILARAQA